MREQSKRSESGYCLSEKSYSHQFFKCNMYFSGKGKRADYSQRDDDVRKSRRPRLRRRLSNLSGLSPPTVKKLERWRGRGLELRSIHPLKSPGEKTWSP